jgi:anaphase-promoting complex subunit 10
MNFLSSVSMMDSNNDEDDDDDDEEEEEEAEDEEEAVSLATRSMESPELLLYRRGGVTSSGGTDLNPNNYTDDTATTTTASGHRHYSISFRNRSHYSTDRPPPPSRSSTRTPTTTTTATTTHETSRSYLSTNEAMYYRDVDAATLLRHQLNYDHEEEEDEEDEEEEEDEIDDVSTSAGTAATTIRAATEHRLGSQSGSGGSDREADGGGITTSGTASPPPPNDGGTEADELLVGSGSSADGGASTVVPTHTSMMITPVSSLQTLLDKQFLREIGMEDIISFQLSSAKPGNGVEQLYDHSYETYWQSDGVCQPHWTQIQLSRRLPVTHVALYLDYQLDESYTPRTVRIETGLTVVQDSQTYHPTTLSNSVAPVMELNEPVGWCIFPIYIPPDLFDTTTTTTSNFVPDVIHDSMMIPRAHWVRISILSMHQNGRDTHVRRVALFCQRTTTMPVVMPQPVSSQYRNTHHHYPSMMEEPDDDPRDDDRTDHYEILLYAQTRRQLATAVLPQNHGHSASISAYGPSWNRNQPTTTLFSTMR